jgi:hypothetical protein
MPLRVGSHAWIPCEVLPGPFPDERLIRVEVPDGVCSGYVDPLMLRDDIAQGRTAVRATILDVNQSVVAAGLPGQTRRSAHLICHENWIGAFVAG